MTEKQIPSRKAAMKKILIVMPAYNEATRIGKVITGLPSSFTIDGKSFATEVVVVDDCSKDDTAAVAQKAGAVVVKHVMNSGAGAATRTGLRYAERQPDVAYVVTIDADGQHVVEDIKKVIEHAIRHDSKMIVGNRLHAGNKQDMPLHRTIGNWGISLICRMLFGIKTKDTQSGLRLFAGDILPIVADYTIDRYGFCTEMLWMAVRNDVVVEEVPIVVKYSAETLKKGQNNWGVVDLLLDLAWIRMSR